MTERTGVHPTAVAGFGSDPDRYDRARPTYPSEAIAALVGFAAPLPGEWVADIAAGTGKLTRLLEPVLPNPVVAVEPVDAMRRFLTGHRRRAHLVAGIAEALPIRSGRVALATVGQAFHWFDAHSAWTELARVVRPGGTVGLIWNVRDRSTSWVDAVWAVMDRYETSAPWRGQGRDDQFAPAEPHFEPPVELGYRHTDAMERDRLIERITSVSHIAVLPPSQRKGVADEIAGIIGRHPETSGAETLRLPYRTDLYLFRRR